MTLQRLIEYAAIIRLSPRAVRLEPEDLKSLNLPCILHWDMNHFVVLHQVNRWDGQEGCLSVGQDLQGMG
nr:hypothetical protein [Klebsiella aerogenes]